MTAKTPPSAACLDCGARLSGPYCSQCGLAAAEAADLSARRPFQELATDLIQYDGNLLHNLRLLVARPGVLTAEYLAGRRARHLPPARLYLLVNFFFFFLVQWFDPVTADIVAETVGAQTYATAQAHAGMATEAFGATVEERIANALPTWLFLLVPALAAVLALLYLRSSRPFAVHASFAFHFMAFTLVAFTPGTVLGGSLGETVSSVAIFVALPVWLVVACRCVYAQGWGPSVAKGAAVWLAFLFLLYGYLLVIDAWALGV